MIGRISSKIISSIAYTVIGSEVVKSAMTRENASKVATLTGKVVTTTYQTVRSKANSLKVAVSQRKVEILTAKSQDKLEEVAKSEETIPY